MTKSEYAAPLPGGGTRRGTCAKTFVYSPFTALSASLFALLMASGCSNIGEPPPTAAAPVPQAAVAAAPPPEVDLHASPDQVRAEVVRWFSAAGYQPAQAQAVADYVKIESGFRPCVTSGAGYHYMFQWAGTRLQRLNQFAGARGCPPVRKQLAFADRELRTEPAYACFWDATTRSGALSALRRGFGRGNC